MTDNKTLTEADRQFLANNLKGLLQDTLEWMDVRNAELRADTGFAHATPAEARLFAVLRGRERSISELARALGVSRQAVHHTVHRLISAGVVELAPAAHSRREKLVRITEAGGQIQTMAARNLRQIEKEVAGHLGKENVQLIRTLLMKLMAEVRS